MRTNRRNDPILVVFLVCGFINSASSAEFLVHDETFTMTEEGHGFHYFQYDQGSPSDWTTPDDYYSGQWHVRYEIINQPSSRPCQLQTCIWADWDYPSHWTETCPVHTTLKGPGDVVEASCCPATWWNLHSDDKVDFSEPDTFRHLGVPLWSDNTKLVSDWVTDSDWELRGDYFPLELRVTVVAVSSGSSFSGWKHYIPDRATRASAKLRFEHHFIDTDLGQTSGQMADVGRLGLADIDNDGDLDFALGVRHKQAYWYEFQGRNSWAKHTLGPWDEQKLGGAPYDVDGDGHVDFVTGGSWYRNPGNPRTAPFTEFLFDPAGDHSMHDVVVADIDMDGKQDIVLQSDNAKHGGLFWWDIAAEATGHWTKHVICQEKHHGSIFPGGVGDLDGDGDNDVVDVYRWLENDGSGRGWEAHSIPFGRHGRNEKTSRGTAYGYGWSARSVIVDIDADGDNDIVAVDCDQVDSTAAILYNDGKGNFTRAALPQNAPRYGSFHSLQVADFDNDGMLDVATVEQQDITWQIFVSPRWILWKQLRGNFWQENFVVDNSYAGHDMACGDVDGDGDIDLVAKVWNAYAAGSGTWGTREPEYVSFVENTSAATEPTTPRD
jgi:FG-GAP-like repeat